MSDTIVNLKKARQLIAERGWIQGAGGDLDRGVCAYSAVYFAKGESYATFAEEIQLARTLPDSNFSTLSKIITFNDTEGRTKEEVLKLFDDTIARLEVQEVVDA